MTSEEIIREIASLPSEAKREVEDLIARLRKRYDPAKPGAINGLETEEFFGIWSDRDDMTDSTAWVRSVREKHWAK